MIEIAIPVENGRLSSHFGHCQSFAMITADETTQKVLGTRQIPAPPHEPGLLPRWLREQGAQIILAGGMGVRAQQLFAESGIQVVVGVPPEAPEALAASFLAGTLETGSNACDHGKEGHGHRCRH
jgi:predicted Fe-Mo cluster-binding NifX family protein